MWRIGTGSPTTSSCLLEDSEEEGMDHCLCLCRFVSAAPGQWPEHPIVLRQRHHMPPGWSSSCVEDPEANAPKSQLETEVPDLTPPSLSNPAGRVQMELDWFPCYSPHFLPRTKIKQSSALHGTPKLQSQGYIITCTISSNNACIVQGANQERNCHHPLHWVVFSDLSGSIDCLRNKGLQKFVPSAHICQSRELLCLSQILQMRHWEV